VTHVLLAPHNDDETLFAAFVAQKHRAHVHVCLYDTAERCVESRVACDQLGLPFTQWTFDARDPDWDGIRERMRQLTGVYDHVIAPAPRFDSNGHSDGQPDRGFGVFQHDWVGKLAAETWGPERTVLYTTYTRWGGRDRDGTEVKPQNGWVANKMRALSCYTSQHHQVAVGTWFLDIGLREYVA